MTNLGLFDCDTHCYEPRDAFTRYLPNEFARPGHPPGAYGKGDEAILAGNRVAMFNSESGLGFDMAYRPGSLKEMLRQMGSGNPDETYEPEPIRPGVPRAGPPPRGDGPQGVEQTRVVPRRHGAGRRALRATTPTRSTPTCGRSTAGTTRSGASITTTRSTRRRMLSLRDLDSAVAETDAPHRRRRAASCSSPPARPTAVRRATPTSIRSGRASTKPASPSRSTSCRSGTSTPSRPRGVTPPTPPRGTCRRGSGSTSTANDRSRTRSRH